MFGNIYNKDAPGQLYHIGTYGLTCELAEPDDALKGHIHYYWLMEVDDQAIELEVIPDAAIDLVVSPDLPNFSCVYLPTTEKFTIPLQGPIRYAGVCFHTETAPSLLCATLEQIRDLDQGAATTKTLQLSALIEAISGEVKLTELCALFDTFFHSRLSQQDHMIEASILNNLVENLGTRKYWRNCEACWGE